MAALVSTVEGVILSSPRRGHCWSQITECSGDFFLTPQLCIQKWVTWAKPRPF